ncbi:trypsin-like peptidase domain-containing protein [Thermopolyspora sp. NPDC052614]|uniref:trypsin-like serine peptidase n=1 Tax=Thermopolyspora sp. NPDC052614 TaxID=3155682 RepID=UPI00342186AC
MTPSLPLMAAVCLAAVVAGPVPAGPTPIVRTGPAHARGDDHPGPHLGPHPVSHPGPHHGIVQYTAALDAAEQRRILAYWTPGRMAGAVPIDPIDPLGLIGGLDGLLSPATRRHQAAGPVTATSGARWIAAGRRRPAAPGTVGATTGRVFLTLNGRDFVCSASSVRAANRDLVVTAAHCVKDGIGAWARNWTFVPGYDGGRRPFGAFTARRAFVTAQWSRGADDDHDVAMVAVNPVGGRHLADVVGAQPIAFNTPRGAYAYGFGFPADPPYSGRDLMYCAGPLRDDPNRQTRGQGLRCDLTAGASGGPWLSGFNPAAGVGTITSVSSFKYSNDRHTMYGPYFDDTVRRLHAIAEKA